MSYNVWIAKKKKKKKDPYKLENDSYESVKNIHETCDWFRLGVNRLSAPILSIFYGYEREWEWALLARYVYTYEEFVIVTEAPQCNRKTTTGQDTDNKNNNIQI